MIGLYFTPISVFGGKTRGLLVLAVNSWASLTMAEVRLGLEAAGSRLQREVIDEASFWSAATPPTPELRSPTVHLLQGYDEYIMGHTETKHVLARPGATWSPTTPPVFTLVVLLDGRPAGFWRRTPTKDSVVVEVALLEAVRRRSDAGARSRSGQVRGVPESGLDGRARGAEDHNGEGRGGPAMTGDDTPCPDLLSPFLVARCGMVCGLCIGHLRAKNRCPRCNGDDADKPRHCVACRIKHCEERAAEEGFCFGCATYPCARLRQLDRRYRSKYGMSLIENLETVRTLGLEAFVVRERERWRCPACGGVICVRREDCLH